MELILVPNDVELNNVWMELILVPDKIHLDDVTNPKLVRRGTQKLTSRLLLGCRIH